jgi:hypothetical protein
MVKSKLASAAAACAVAAAGIVAAATPAHAVIFATYKCMYSDPANGTTVTIEPVHTTWQVSNGMVKITTDLQPPMPLPAGNAYTIVNGSTVSNWGSIPLGYPIILLGSGVTGSVSASNPLVLHLQGPPFINITCTRLS